MGGKQKKFLLTGALVLAALTAAFGLLLRGSGAEVVAAFSALSPQGLLLLLVLEGGYQGMEALVCRTMVRTRLPRFSLWQAWKVVHLKIFGDVTSFGTASVPMQAYALRRLGLPAGEGVGMMTLEYVFHKGSILLYASVLLALQWGWLGGEDQGATAYLLPAYGVVALIITCLVLLCLWPGVQRGALWLVDRLPERGKWPQRKASFREQLRRLQTQSQALLGNKGCCARLLLLNAGKLALLFSLPWACMNLLGAACPSFYRMQMLSAMMLLITSALPNVAGVGPTEFAFLLLFTPYAGPSQTAVALLLYRGVTYYAPFLASIYPFCAINRGKAGEGTA